LSKPVGFALKVEIDPGEETSKLTGMPHWDQRHPRRRLCEEKCIARLDPELLTQLGRERDFVVG